MNDKRTEGSELHRGMIVIDMVYPLGVLEAHLDEPARGGVTVVGVTVAIEDFCAAAMSAIGSWYERFGRLGSKLLHVQSAADVHRAKQEGKLGIVFHFQNTQPFERDSGMVEVYYRLGLRMAQITYNVKNWVGDGCDERTDAGLSEFGRRVIREMNRVGMVVDLSHTGYRTTMDAMEVSEAPVVFSHSNAKAVWGSRRNLTDDQIKALAEKGGVIGLNGFPAFVGERTAPTLDDLLRHADHIANLVGTDHLGLGLDYFKGMVPFASDQEARQHYDWSMKLGRWKAETYPPPPYRFPEGIEVPSRLHNLTAALLRRGYTAKDVGKIMGGNWLRVCERVWK